MIIDSMGLTMGSARSYRSTSGSGERFAVASGAARTAATHEGTFQYYAETMKAGMTDQVTKDMERSMLGRRGELKGVQSEVRTEDLSTVLRRQSLLYLMRHLHQIMAGRSRFFRNGMNGQGAEPAPDVSQESGQNGLSNYGESFFYYKESEETTFATKGYVKTADGREISFAMELSMTRSFEEYYYSTHPVEPAVRTLLDPLVINFNGPAAEVTDQKFLFDLDADGKKEEISSLGAGSGFLAYDRNGDGIINDGSELFGAKSGDGFSDLAKFDQDGNGWIDEADDIFQKLKVWTKDSQGKDKLLSLKEIGVGAICLSKAATQFSLNNQVSGEMNGLIRSTGFFLFERGEVGTVQQVDLTIG